MTKHILGISAGFHDAAATVIDADNGNIVFASQSERFSKRKHDPELSLYLINEALSHGTIGTIAYYENHWLKSLRQYLSGEDYKFYFSLRKLLSEHFPFHPIFLENVKVKSFDHHKSHAAAGFQTSPFDNATVVVIDAIGEFDTITIWNASYNKNGEAKYKLKWKQSYPHSIGLFYSAMTANVGLKPLDEEYILMGMAAYGNAQNIKSTIENNLIESIMPPQFKENLHIGTEKINADKFDIAAATQELYEEMLCGILEISKKYDMSNNLVLGGGSALNCLANRLLGAYYENVWIMPAPGDAGSSLGAAALEYGKKINWKDAYLGYNIEGEYPVKSALKELLDKQIVGIANGRAEFGPRSLGNRSLLADPRSPQIKDKVNRIKQRQKFRPFAPVILEEYVNDYFIMPMGFEKSEYMQVVALCKKPNEFPGIVHYDDTSRVQTVPKNNSGIRKLLEEWHKETGCPMLLNTSLNVRGMPMVNDELDAKQFEEIYSIKVFTKD